MLIALGIFLFTFYVKAGAPNLIKEKSKESSVIYPIIVPHFDTFKSERQKFLQGLSVEIKPNKIILLSIDHYGSGKQNISSTNKTWQLKDKSIELEKATFTKLTSEDVISDDENAFLDEHGIKNIIPDLALYFPDAPILPIMVKDATTQGELDKLYAGISENCINDCLIVGSVDFSHYNPSSLAQIHDNFSINALNNLDESKVQKAETDSPNILSILVKLAKSQMAQGFKLDFNSNSGEKSKDDSVETTSVVIGQFQKDKINNKSTTLMFAGDMMTDRMINHNFKEDLTKVFDRLGNRVFWGTDSAILNNEGPISSEPIKDDITANNLVFNFPRSTIDALKYLHIDTVTLANNHSFNAGREGFGVTQQLLKDAGIKYFGNQNTFDEDSILNIDSDIPVSMMSVNLLSVSDLAPIKAVIKSAEENGRFVIIYPHWGNEYQNSHNSSQKQIATELIQSGADMIVGSHPHVVQDFEIIDGKPVIYSLGNFLFDQTFSKPTMEGLVVGFVIKDKSVDVSFFPTKQVNLKPQLMMGDEKATKIRTIFDIDGESGFTKVRSDTIEINSSMNN